MNLQEKLFRLKSMKGLQDTEENQVNTTQQTSLKCNCGIIVVGKIGGDDYLKQSVVQSTSSNHLKTFAESKSALLKFEYILVVML